jgi:hypothetical protein
VIAAGDPEHPRGGGERGGGLADPAVTATQLQPTTKTASAPAWRAKKAALPRLQATARARRFTFGETFMGSKIAFWLIVYP